MLSCSIGKISSVILRKSLSGYTFVEFNVPLETYTDSPTFDLTIDDTPIKYSMAGCDVHMQEGGKAVLHITGIPESQKKWMDLKPLSVESMEVADFLNAMKLKNGPRISTSFVNLFLTYGQLAIVLANMSPRTAFINFEKGTVEYYADMYKKKPLKVNGVFSRLYTRAPLAGFVGWENYTTGYYPSDAQTVLSFGQFTNVDQSIMENLVKNCNEISSIFSDMQSFTATHTCELGDTVVSNLTYDKKIIVGAEEHYDLNDCVTAIYYCV